MLRIYIAQQCFGLSDEGIEGAIYDSQAIRRFVGIDLSHESGFFYNLVRHYSMRKVAALFLGVVVTISAFGDVTETITRQPNVPGESRLNTTFLRSMDAPKEHALHAKMRGLTGKKQHP